MKYLIVETVANKPHLEASGEMALKLQKQGHEVLFCWLGSNNLWSEWDLSLGHKLLGCSFKKRVKGFLKILIDNGITVLQAPILNLAEKQEISIWAGQNITSQKMLKALTFESATLGMGVASSLISLFRDAEYNPTEDKKQVSLALKSTATIYKLTETLINEFKPDEMVTFNGRFATARPIVQASKKAGLSILRHERGSTFKKYNIFNDSLHDCDYIAGRIKQHWEKASKQTRNEIAQEFYDKKRQRIPVAYSPMGDKSYVEAQQIGLCPPKIDGIKRVVFFTSSDDEFAAIFDVDIEGNWKDQHDATISLIAAIKKIPNMELVIRLHPNLQHKSDKDKQRWYAYTKQGVTIVKDDAKIDTYALLDTADIAVTHGSTIGMEAAYSGLPVMLLSNATYADITNIYKPTNENEILNILNKSKYNLVQKEDTYPFAHYFYTTGEDYKFYQPTSITEGKFMGQELPWESHLFKSIKRLKNKIL